MGKLIISETEKKNILSLYEQVKFPIPAPRESILIDNKNPYKHQEYINARQNYSTKLENGSLFYIIGLLPDNLNYEKVFKKIAFDFLKSLIGKTIRVKNGDVYTFKDIIETNDDDIVAKMVVLKNNEKSIDWTVRYNGNRDGFKFYDWYDSYYDFDKINTLFIEYLNKNKNVLENTNIKNIPDEYFEIRKVKRQQTDF